MKPMVTWNQKLKLIVSDVDETIADLYTAAAPEMIDQLIRLLDDGKVLVLITGQSVTSMRWRIVDSIPAQLRHRVLLGSCSGAEVWGFERDGSLRETPFYSRYEETLSPAQRETWRTVMRQLLDEFHLEPLPAQPIEAFRKQTRGNPFAVIYEDRGPQITLEFVNAYLLSPEQLRLVSTTIGRTIEEPDLRPSFKARAEELLAAAAIPITPRLAGVFALDLAIGGISKTTAVRFVVENRALLERLGLTPEELTPEVLEIWGDKFSVVQGGTDRHMSEALSPAVRSITFREEPPDEFLPGYNTVVWDGKEHLHRGLLEFLQQRSR